MAGVELEGNDDLMSVDGQDQERPPSPAPAPHNAQTGIAPDSTASTLGFVHYTPPYQPEAGPSDISHTEASPIDLSDHRKKRREIENK